MYPFAYHVTCCNEYTEFKNEMHQGVTFGKNMAEAMAHIESYYGDEMVKCEVFYIDGEQEVIELSEDTINELEKESV